MKTELSKRSRILLTITALGIFILALLWGSFLRQRFYDRKDAIHFAVEKNSNLAVALEQYAISTLHNADAVLQLVRLEYSREGADLNLQKLLEKTTLKQEVGSKVVLLNREGKRIAIERTPGTNPSDDSFYRECFRFHLANSTDSLFISKPVLPKGAVTPVILISRRLYSSSGEFEGVVVLQMPPSNFTAFYSGARLLPNDIISLVAPDGTTYARRTGSKESSGENISKSPLYVHLAQNTDSFYFAPDALRGIPTWFSYRKLKNYPIIATVGSSEADIFSNYAIKESRIMVPRIIVSIVIVLFSVFLGLILLQKLKSQHKAVKAKEEYERLLTEQMIAAQEMERERIGRELHDNINQVLTTVKLYLEMASTRDANPLIPRSMQLVNSTIAEIRNVSHQLTAPTLGTRSLVDAVDALIEGVSSSSSLSFQFDHTGYNERLNMSQKLALYRILQEQMNNILKHAHATRVLVRLTQKNGRVLLTVRDDGKGFDAKAKFNGMGLNNITSRVKVFGGVVRIESAPQRGCFLSVAVPVEAFSDKEVAKRPFSFDLQEVTPH